MRILLAITLLAVSHASAFAGTIRGNLINGTTNQPGKAQLVRVMDLASGMDQIATLTDVEDKFQFDDIPSRTGAPYLIQVQADDIIYSQPVQLPDQEVAVDFFVFDATESLDAVSTTMYNIVFQRDGDVMNIMQLVEFQNTSDPPTAVWRDNGPIYVELPEGMLERARVQVTTTSGMPLKQELLEADEPGVYTVPQALKPGITRLVVEARVPYEGASLEWTGSMHHNVQLRTLLVSPADISVHGTGLVQSTRESPLEGYAVYEGTALGPGDQFEIHLDGGSEQFVDPHAGLDMGEHGPNDGHDHSRDVTDVQARDNPLTGARPLIMAGLGLTLLLGLMTGVQRRADPAVTRSHELVALEDRYLAGGLTKDEFVAARDQLLSPPDQA